MMRSILFHWDHGYAWLEFSLLSLFDAFHSLRFFLALPFFNVLNCINLIFPSFFPPALKTPGFLRKCVIYFCWFGRGFQLFVRRNVSGWLETRGRAPTALPSQTWEPERWEKLLPKPVSVETAAVLAEHVHTALTGAWPAMDTGQDHQHRFLQCQVLVIRPCPQEWQVRREKIDHSAFYPGRQLGLWISPIQEMVPKHAKWC